MKKFISIMLLSGLLVGCADKNDDVQDSQSEQEPFSEQQGSQEIEFTSGVDESGVSQADNQNYMDITGQSYDNKNIYVIYNGTVIDELETDNNGQFKYHSRANKDKTQITFSNDESLRSNSLGVHTNSLSNHEEVTVLPNKNFVENEKKGKIQSEDSVTASNEFKVGSSAIFTSDTDNSIEITVNSLERFSGDKLDQPEGVYFLKVNYTIENLSEIDYPAKAQIFSAYDGNNEKAKMISKDYFSENIAAGKKASGVSYFDVQNEGPFEVHALGACWIGDIE